ncbi:HNH endonuclease signature motif containing protein [Propionivibrio sp.]|uniref:HNH endonuclease signature motif containing protein n=1 Tax=Propionivibrio sp. TaxID=2212460 RepID=UPI003BF3F7F2
MRGNRYKSNPVKDRFIEKIKIDINSECWIWQGNINKTGHGRFRVSGKMLVASRVSYQLFIGEIPENMLVCHKCDVRSCVNPDHLFVGTYQDNYDDMVEKGRERKAKGENSGVSKLTDMQVKEIRNGKESLRTLAKTLGVSYGHIGKIRRNELRII